MIRRQRPLMEFREEAERGQEQSGSHCQNQGDGRRILRGSRNRQIGHPQLAAQPEPVTAGQSEVAGLE